MSNIPKSPMGNVKEKFESKEKLVEKLIGLIPKNDSKSNDEVKKSLLKTSNKKLLKLHSRFSK